MKMDGNHFPVPRQKSVMNDSSSSSRCPRCGALLPSEGTGALCPVCLMAQAMLPTRQEGAAASPRPPLSPEEIAPHFPHLEILACLGRGGMGVVYKARQKSLNRLVALKLLAPERADDAGFSARFQKEARALAALNHPHIVTVHDFGRSGEFFFLLMEFVDGVNLRQLLQTRRLTPKEALSIVPPVCEALQYAHDRGVVHRDIKPENLLLDKEGRVKIADFGIARMMGETACLATSSSAATGASSLPAGTPDYAAPEQHDPRGSADHRADIYSLGVVLYEMLTGERPKDIPVPPSKRVVIDVRIDEIVLRALEKSPELRFQTAAELGTQVETVVNQRSPGLLDSVTSNRPKRSRWHKVGVSTLIALAIALPVRWLLLGAYVVSGDSTSPELPKGSRILVWKLARVFAPGDIIAYDHEGNTYVGRVVRVGESTVTVHRNGQSEEDVPRALLTGKVISVYWRATPKELPKMTTGAAAQAKKASEDGARAADESARLRKLRPKPYEFKKAMLGDVLRFLAAESGMNCHSLSDDAPASRRLIDLSMVASPFEVLEELARTQGLELKLDQKNVWRITARNPGAVTHGGAD